MKIDPKDLRLMKGNEVTPGGFFYLKTAEGEYDQCCIQPEEFADENRTLEVRAMTRHYLDKGLLFVNRNAPLKTITGIL